MSGRSHSDDLQQCPTYAQGEGWYVDGVRHETPDSVLRILRAAGISDARRIMDLARGADGVYPSVPHSWVKTPQTTAIGVVEYREAVRS